jgi:hypothetical protein
MWRKAEIAEKQERANLVKEMIATRKQGTMVIDTETGRQRGLSSLDREHQKLTDEIAKHGVALELLERKKLLTPQGQEELLARSQNPALPPELREKAKLDLEAAKAERARQIKLSGSTENGSHAVGTIMKADGFDAKTIKECNVTGIMNTASLASPGVYQAKIQEVTNEMQAVEAERLAELRAAVGNEAREDIKEKFAKKLALLDQRRRLATHNYYRTARGLAELKAEAYEKTRMTRLERAKRVARYEEYVRMRTEYKNDQQLRKEREIHITEAYEKAGKDPKEALKACRRGYMEETPGQKVPVRISKPAEQVKSRSFSMMFTEDEAEVLEANCRAEGYASMSAYLDAKTDVEPTSLYEDTTIAALHAKAEMFTNGEYHRQPTRASGLRNVRYDLKVTPLKHRKMRSLADTYLTTGSSVGRHFALGMDPRQIQNDRSEETNTIRAEGMEKLMRTESHVA